MLDSRKGGALAHFILSAAAAMGLSETAAQRATAPTERLNVRLPRHLRGSGNPGKSPALSGPHSPRLVHVRGRGGVHYWFTENEWARNASSLGELPGDVVERVNGYGQVTSRHRVPA